LELSGKRGITFFRYQGVRGEQNFTQFEDRPGYHEVEVLADRYLAAFIAGKIDRVEVVYTKFHNAARQEPVVETLLPLSPAAPTSLGRAWGGASPPPVA